MSALDATYMAAFRKARPSVPKVLAWIEALRSGRYTQTTQTLCDDQGLCCLGVAAAIMVHEVDDDTYTETVGIWLRADLGFENGPPNIHDDWWSPFATANDDDGWSFDQIADWLEKAINLQRTIDLLRHLPDERFNMRQWRMKDGARAEIDDERLMHDCGTAACIAGWAAIFYPDRNFGSLWRATIALGLPGPYSTEADTLFTPRGFDAQPEKFTRQAAIETLERFRDTGVIEWTS